jgi:hypothetical protein
VVLCVPTSIVDAYDTLLEGELRKHRESSPFSCIAHTCHAALSHFAKRTHFAKTERDPKNYLKKNYLIGKNCGCCKKEMTNLKILLNNISPAGICDEICDYNLYCSKCKELNDKENKYINQKYRYKELAIPELQINFFKTQMPTPIYLSNTCRVNLTTFRKEIDNVMDTDQRKFRGRNFRVTDF